MRNGIKIKRTASALVAEIHLDGHKTTIDLSSMTKDERAHIARSMFAWAKRGFVGYPDLPQAA